jgi:hypothetical protein
VQEASAELAGFERRGGCTAAARRKLEEALAAAKGRAEEPWAQRVEGARLAVTDARSAEQAFVGEHLAELVEDVEAAGEAAAAEINAAAEELSAAYQRWQAAAQELGALAGQVGRTHPGDVSRSRADAAATAAADLVLQGGEVGPRLLRDPRLPRHGAAMPEALV